MTQSGQVRDPGLKQMKGVKAKLYFGSEHCEDKVQTEGNPVGNKTENCWAGCLLSIQVEIKVCASALSIDFVVGGNPGGGGVERIEVNGREVAPKDIDSAETVVLVNAKGLFSKEGTLKD